MELLGWSGVINQIFGNQDSITALPASGTQPTMRGFLNDYASSLTIPLYPPYPLYWHSHDILWTYQPKQAKVINELGKH